MGPSGSGKSTLLTIAGSLEEPTSGDVLIDGRSVRSMSRDDKARLRRRTIGYVFQDFNLLAGLTAAENVSLPLELDGVPAKKARAVAVTALGQVGIIERSAHYPDELSGGERQRVAIARAILGERNLLLADEPSGTLDSASGEAVMNMIRDACKRGVAAVVVTHDAHLASWADQVILLRDGCTVDRGLPKPQTHSPCRRIKRAHHRSPHVKGDMMSTAVLAPVADTRPADGGVPARRAVVRWAWRLFRREWRQQFLILALIVVAVAATIIGSAVATNTPQAKNFGFGSAGDSATYSSLNAHVTSDIAYLEHRFGPVEVIENETQSIPGSIKTFQLRSENPQGPFIGPMLALVSGHYPTGADEVAVTSSVASAFHLSVGDTWSVGGVERRVVGTVENPQSLLDEFA